MKTYAFSVAMVLAGFVGMSSNLRAESYYTSGHGDLGIEYPFLEDPNEDPNAFEPHWHLHTGAVYDGITVTDEEGEEFAPGDLTAVISATDTASGAVASALGVSDGSTVFRLGTSAFEPELGFGLEELNPDDWEGNITITLNGVTGPGQMAYFYVDGTNSTLIFSSATPGSTYANNVFEASPGADIHQPWYFSEAGDYTVTFTWSGTYIGEGADVGGTHVESTASFNVAAVPEPGTLGMLSMAALGVIAWRGRRLLKANV